MRPTGCKFEGTPYRVEPDGLVKRTRNHQYQTEEERDEEFSTETRRRKINRIKTGMTVTPKTKEKRRKFTTKP